MTDKSKAQWPDGMKWDSPTCIIIDEDTEIACLTSDDLSSKNSDVAEMINRHRFGQICALPEIVEFLHAIYQSRDSRGASYDFSHAAEKFLKKIGEIE